VKGRNLPIRRKDFDVQGFVAFVAEQGGEIGMPTNAYEVCRYKAFWRGTSKIATHIVYAKENGLLAFTGSSLGHYRAYLDGAPMEELPGAPSKPKTAAAKTVSKSAKARAKLIERDGDGCWFCAAPLGDDATIEHLIPKAKGGLNALANYVLAHRKCNADAADLPLVEKIAMRARLQRVPS
jgi:hypothetical protein